MTFEEFDDSDLALFRQQLEGLVRERALPFGDIGVTQEAHSSLLEVTGVVTSDALLNPSGSAAHRRIRVSVKLFTQSPETDREVLWGRMWYCVEKDRANFFPVPADYGDYVTIEFGWEFDRETLDHGCAEVRDRASVHYVSVFPNPQFVAFIEACSEVGENWTG